MTYDQRDLGDENDAEERVLRQAEAREVRKVLAALPPFRRAMVEQSVEQALWRQQADAAGDDMGPVLTWKT